MEDLTDSLTDTKKKPRKKREPKAVSLLDESIDRLFKKDRIGAKVTKSKSLPANDNEKLNYILDKIYELINSSSKDHKSYLYILDKLYPDSVDIKFLTAPSDSYTIVINNDIIYDDLKKHQYVLTEYSKIYFYDDRNGLTDQV